MKVYLNGTIHDHERAAVPVADRGFIFGDGIYEVIRSVNGRLFREKEHMMRLQEGIDGLQIRLDPADRDRLPYIGRDLLRQNGQLEGEATIYIQITRGAAWPRTHGFPEPEVKPGVFLYTAPFQPNTSLHEKGVGVITVADLRWSRCNLKTINLLANVMARQRAYDAGANSAVMIRDGVVTESPNANIFGVKSATLYTFPVSNYILAGITRQVVIEIAEKLQIPVQTVPVREEEIHNLDELFFTGTTTDIQPVIEIDGRTLGGGKPGPFTRRIQAAYSQKLRGQ